MLHWTKMGYGASCMVFIKSFEMITNIFSRQALTYRYSFHLRNAYKQVKHSTEPTYEGS